MVSDEEENTAPLFVECLRKYHAAAKADPTICFVKTPGAVDLLEQRCRAADVSCDAFQFTGDYYAPPSLVPMLSRPSRLEVLMEVVEYPLPVRRTG